MCAQMDHAVCYRFDAFLAAMLDSFYVVIQEMRRDTLLSKEVEELFKGTVGRVFPVLHAGS